MKCVCGYYKFQDFEIEAEDISHQDELRKHNGDEDFIPLQIKVRTENPFNVHERMLKSNKNIYACPKCGTLKIRI